MTFTAVRARIQNKSRESGIPADVLYRRYLLERFIARIAASEHRDSIIIKGGMLLSAIAGIDMRATRDLDTTIRGNRLTIADFEKIVKDVIAAKVDDDVTFTFDRADEIVLDSSYPCCRVRLRAKFGTANERVDIDVTTGDVITPHEIEFGFPTLFGDEKLPILAYTLETVLAEKITAILDLGVLNTRAKDFYDLHLITTTQADRIDKPTFAAALRNTLRRRGKESLLDQSRELIHDTLNSHDIQEQWKKYSAQQSYAAQITFSQIAGAVITVSAWAGIEFNIRADTKTSWAETMIAKANQKNDEYNRNGTAPKKSKNEQEH
jgi:predicted nucleotidyltransferase component of viral defense system